IYCFDEEVADEADHEQARHDVHGRVVGLRFRHAVSDVVLADVVHQYWTEDASRRPRGEQHAVNRADVARAEHVSQISGYGREATAVHADDYEEAADEPDDAADRAGVRHGAVEAEAEHHEHEVRVAPADVVRRGGPEEPAAHVEQTHQTDEACRCYRRDVTGEHFLTHRGGLAEDADAGGHVKAEHPPDQPELWRLQRVVDENVVLGDQFRCSCRRDIALRLPARCRYAHDDRTDDHEEEIDAAHHDERLGDADMSR